MVDLAAVYSRTIDGKTITLAASGWTYKRTFVLYDKESMSLWYPVQEGLKGISGKYLDRVLPQLDASYTRWRTWVEKHPQSKLLK